MGMMVGRSNSNKRVIQFKNPNGSVAATVSVSKPSQTKTKKRLQYNFKAISSQILLSKNSNSASKAVTKARGTIAILLRKMKTGEYDDKELELAIVHAKKMERIAKKRVKHLKQEEEIKQKGSSSETEDGSTEELEKTDGEQEQELSEEELQQLLEEYQKIMQESMEELMRETMQELSEEAEFDELSEEVAGAMQDMDAEDLESLKKKHRSDEMREIVDADMKYLRAIFNKLEKEKQALSNGTGSANNMSGVSLELSGFDVPVETAEMPVMMEGGSIDMTV